MSYRYIGNKTRLLPWLLSHIRRLVSKGTVVADLMCGTASVSEALRFAGYRVIASDLMTYSAHHARVRLTMQKAPIFAGLGGMSYREVLDELGNLPPTNGLVVREYSPAGKPLNGYPSRAYFSAENAAKIDAINNHLNEWEQKGRLTLQEDSLLRHDLILAANKVANIAGTYGHFMAKWCNGSLSPIKLTATKFISKRFREHLVLQGPAEEIAPSLKADLCYLDPPYMKRQYAANYHLIETLARGDEPDAVGVSGLRPWRDQYSDFCSKLKIRDAFRKIIGTMDCPIFLISYSEDGLLNEEQLRSLFEEFGKMTVYHISFQRFRSNASNLGTTVTESLFILEKC